MSTGQDAQTNGDRKIDARTMFALLCGTAAFVLTLLFYGVATNLVMLATAASLLAAGLIAKGVPKELPQSTLLKTLLATLVLTYVQLFSMSPDSSFPVVWIFGLAVLGSMYALGLGDAQRLLWKGVASVVLLLAALSAFRLISTGDRPGAPLTDHNNYAALLYVVLFPIAHSLLLKAWSGKQDGTWWAGLFAIALLSFVIAGTGSRAALLVLCGAATFWIVFTLSNRLSFWPLFLVLASGLFGVTCFEAAMKPEVMAAPGVESLAGGVSIRATLIDAALQMYRGHELTGIGPLVFPLLYRQVRGAADEDTAGLFVHNDYVQLFVEGGPLLVAPLVMLLFWVSVALFRALSRARSVDSVANVGYVLSLAALLVHAAANFVVYSAVLSLVIGLLVARLAWSNQVPASIGAVVYRKVLIAPSALLGAVALSLLWLDVAIAVVLQGQPAAPFGSRIDFAPEAQLRFANVAQELNPRRGLPLLATAVFSDQKSATSPSPETAEKLLGAYRDAMAADPWNTGAWLVFRDFVLRNPGVAHMLADSEHPSAITQEILRLDPIFVSAIEARLQELIVPDAIETKRLQLGFLAEHVGPRLTWLARQQPDAASHYVEVLIANAGTTAERTRWEFVKQQLLAIEPNVPEQWFISDR